MRQHSYIIRLHILICLYLFRYSCEPGFAPSMIPPVRVCEDDGDGDPIGRWSKDEPECIREYKYCSFVFRTWLLFSRVVSFYN